MSPKFLKNRFTILTFLILLLMVPLLFKSFHSEKDKDKKSQDSPSLHEAIAKGKEKTAALLIKRGADVNAVDKYGNRPLDIAVTGGRSGYPIDWKMAPFLKKHGGKQRPRFYD